MPIRGKDYAADAKLSEERLRLLVKLREGEMVLDEPDERYVSDLDLSISRETRRLATARSHL